MQKNSKQQTKTKKRAIYCSTNTPSSLLFQKKVCEGANCMPKTGRNEAIAEWLSKIRSHNADYVAAKNITVRRGYSLCCGLSREIQNEVSGKDTKNRRYLK